VNFTDLSIAIAIAKRLESYPNCLDDRRELNLEAS